MKNRFIAAAVSAALMAGAPASATVLNFDELPTIFEESYPLAPGYLGFDWDNVRALNGINQGEGYGAGVVSSPNVIFNIFGLTAAVSSANPFTLNSAYFTSAFGDQIVTVAGYNGGTQVFSDSFQAFRAGPTLRAFPTLSITSFTFFGHGNQIVLDNVTVNQTGAVPEPASWAMMLAGFGAIGATLRRRGRMAAARAA